MGQRGSGVNEENHIVNGTWITWLIDDSISAIFSVPFYPLPFCPRTCHSAASLLTLRSYDTHDVFCLTNSVHFGLKIDQFPPMSLLCGMLTPSLYIFLFFLDLFLYIYLSSKTNSSLGVLELDGYWLVTQDCERRYIINSPRIAKL